MYVRFVLVCLYTIVSGISILPLVLNDPAPTVITNSKFQMANGGEALQISLLRLRGCMLCLSSKQIKDPKADGDTEAV